jgi:hypothetical protein
MWSTARTAIALARGLLKGENATPERRALRLRHHRQSADQQDMGIIRSGRLEQFQRLERILAAIGAPCLHQDRFLRFRIAGKISLVEPEVRQLRHHAAVAAGKFGNVVLRLDVLIGQLRQRDGGARRIADHRERLQSVYER